MSNHSQTHISLSITSSILLLGRASDPATHTEVICTDAVEGHMELDIENLVRQAASELTRGRYNIRYHALR